MKLSVNTGSNKSIRKKNNANYGNNSSAEKATQARTKRAPKNGYMSKSARIYRWGSSNPQWG